MTIEKNGKAFFVKENKNSWTLTTEAGVVSVSYNVPKDNCPTFDALRAYVIESNLF